MEFYCGYNIQSITKSNVEGIIMGHNKGYLANKLGKKRALLNNKIVTLFIWRYILRVKKLKLMIQKNYLAYVTIVLYCVVIGFYKICLVQVVKS